jgi:hypothetical protein
MLVLCNHSISLFYFDTQCFDQQFPVISHLLAHLQGGGGGGLEKCFNYLQCFSLFPCRPPFLYYWFRLPPPLLPSSSLQSASLPTQIVIT